MNIPFEYMAEISKIGGRVKEMENLKNDLVYADEIVINDQAGMFVGKYKRNEEDEWLFEPNDLYFT